MDKILTNDEFMDPSIIVSGGDQTTRAEEEYFQKFLNDSLTTIAFAPSFGRLHDEGILYDHHFNLPNFSSTYGNEIITSDYYYTYNNVLFMHINTGSADYAGHSAFIENAIATNPDCVWKIVVLHFSFFTYGHHSQDDIVLRFKNAMAGEFNRLGVDLALSGHDHLYARSNLMLDSTNVSNDVVTNNTVTDPEGTLYICGTKASSYGFYDDEYAISDNSIAVRYGDNRKSAIAFDVSDESLAMRAYFLDGDTPVEFDHFTIYKTNYTPAEMPDSYSVTYVDELGHDFGDSTDVSSYAKRYFTTATPDEPRLSVPSGSLDEGKRMNWYWEYYLLGGNGTETTEFVNGNDYVAYLRCDTVNISRNITIASETDVFECIYTWEDAWELLYQYPGEAFTFTLSEDLTISEMISVKAAVDLTIDLNGKTLTATAVSSHLFEIPKDGAGTALKVISSKAGGVLNTGNRAFSRLESGKGSVITMQFGSVDTYPITVTSSTLVLGKSSFYTSTYNLNVYGGTYNFSRSIVDIRNDGTNYNTYCFNLNDANINMTSSSYTFFYRFDDKCAGANSSFNANNCVFTGKNTTTPKDFFGSEMWKGTASFRDCVFNNVVFDSNLHTNLKGITFGANCVFNNSGNTFTVVTEEPEIPEVPETPVEPEVTVPAEPIVYDFELYNNPLFPDAADAKGYKYSKAESAVTSAYTAGTHNWKVEAVADGVSIANNIKFFSSGNEGVRVFDVPGTWVAFRIRVDRADNYELSITGIHSSKDNDYTADFWIVPASVDDMAAADVESAMIDENKLGTVEVTTTNGVDAAGEYEFGAGEYILIMGVNDDRMSFTNFTLTPKEKEETEVPPVDDPIESPENTIERIPESKNVLGFSSNKVTLEEGSYIVTLSEGVVATVGLNSLETAISVNETVTAGGTLTYTIECTNNLSVAVNAVVAANIPENATFVSADNSGKSSGNTVVWNVQLAAGELKSISFQAVAGAAETFSSLAAVTVDNVRYTTNTATSIVAEKTAAQIGDEAYATLEQAITAATSGDIVTLLDDVSAVDVILPAGVNLDLNGYTLIVDSVLTYSSSAIIDSSEKDTGVLKINGAEGNMISASNSQLPVYDSEAGGYRFFDVTVTSHVVTGGNKYWFKVDAENFDEFYKLIQSGSEVLIKVKMTWDGQEEDVFAAADLAFTQFWASRYNTNSNTYITVSVTENEGVENFNLTPIVTANGVEISCEEM